MATSRLSRSRHHYHTHPRSQETYRLLQIAISMVIDLGFDQTPADVLDQRAYLHLKDPSLMCYESQGQLHSLEAHRALLGCYYLSARYAPPQVILYDFE